MAEPFLSVYDPEANIPTFGASSPNVDVYPNDSIVFDIYNYTNNYLS